MAACEKCWRDAWGIVAHCGGNQADEYARLVKARADNQCTPAEQCGDMHLIIGDSCRCGLRRALGDGGKAG